jgi:hypothetical protein
MAELPLPEGGGFPPGKGNETEEEEEGRAKGLSITNALPPSPLHSENSHYGPSQ